LGSGQLCPLVQAFKAMDQFTEELVEAGVSVASWP